MSGYIPLPIGTKFTLAPDLVEDIGNYWNDVNGNKLTDKTVCSIIEASNVPGYYNFSGLYYADDGTACNFVINQKDMILIETKDTKNQCTCNNFDLFNLGCKCGYLSERKKAGLE